MAILRLALANLRHKKNAAFSFGLIVLIAVMLLDTGLTLLCTLPSYYDYSNDRLNAPHYVIRVPNNLYQEDDSAFFQNDPRVSESETEEIVLMESASYQLGDGKLLVLPNFYDAGRERSLLPLSLVGDTADVPEGEGIYVPLWLKLQGFQAGDPFVFEYKKRLYSYRIAGFFESTWFATMTSNMISFYLDSPAYDALYRDIGGGKMISARLHDPARLDALEADFKAQTSVDLDTPGLNTEALSVKIDTMRSAGTMITTLLSAIFAAFSVVVLAIALLVIRFRISNYIQDNIQNIGALEAIGYTSGQIRLALALECVFAGTIGGVMGVAAGYGLLTLMGTLVSASLGVQWAGVLHIGYDAVSLTAILLAVCATALLATRKIRRLSPVTALRFGLHTHSFRRNVLPLDKGNVPLPMKLACKALAANRWQYAMLALVLCGVTFVSSFAVLTYRNFAVDPAGFVKLMGEEMGDVVVTPTQHADLEALQSMLLQREGVRKVAVYDTSSVNLDGKLSTAQIAEDYAQLETTAVYEGNFPLHDNEIVITGRLSNLLGKKIGDTVTAERSGVRAQYIICGYNQTISNFGLKCMLTVGGMRRLNPDYNPASLNVYLAEGTDSARFISAINQEPFVVNPSIQEESPSQLEADARRRAEEKLQNLLSMYGVDSVQFALMDGDTVVLSGDTSAYLVESVLDQATMMKSTVGTYVVFIGVLCMGILILAALISVLILHLVVKSTVVRRRRELGVYRALGYTAGQLRSQIALSFLPVSLIGVICGAVAGGLFTGPSLSALMYSMGISRLSIMIDPLLLALLAVGVLLATFLIAMAAARPVKKISAYELFTE